MKDLFGKAILDFYNTNNPANILTETSISVSDEMDICYMFRDYTDMPLVEKIALDNCCGSILDVGCGAGSHAIYLQNDKNLKVTAIDFSENAITTCKLRGLQSCEIVNFFNFQSNVKYDTILLLMNGTGICGKLSNLNTFLQKLLTHLAKDGQILIDSTDISYMYDRDAQNNLILPIDMEYFGELQFFLSYKQEKEVPFDWLYLDFETLAKYCENNKLLATKIIEGSNFEYLARIVAK